MKKKKLKKLLNEAVLSSINKSNELMDLRTAYNLLSAELKVEKINSQALISCERANDLMHDKLHCYREVLKDLN